MSVNKVKIGSRILSPNDMNKLLPYSNDIYRKIDNVRSTAKTYNDELFEESKSKNNPIHKDNEFNRHFNNIFSILGERGSGKTSVLLTIKYKLMNQKSDIVLPLIVPEKLGDVSDIVGSLIGSFGDVVEDLCKELKDKGDNKCLIEKQQNDYFDGCRFKENNLLKRLYTEVLKQYRYTKSDYREILIKEYVGFNDYVNMTRNIIDSDQNLILSFEAFINELVRVKNKLDASKEQALIFAFFDDIDLSPNRCTELVNVLLRYLSNVNIVVFISGNKNTFAEALTIDMLNMDNMSYEKMNISYLPLDEKNNEETLFNTRKILVQDILKKAMPPTLRYEIPYKSEKDRAEFGFSTKEEGSELNYPTLKELIVEKLIGKENDFLSESNKIIYPYFKVIDSTSRGAMNVYYFLNNLGDTDHLVKLEKANNIRLFINVLTSSSKVLSKYQSHINNIIDIRDEIEDTFIDYEYIKSIQRPFLAKEIMPIEDALTLFMLANFVENIVSIEINKIHGSEVRKVHGYNTLSEILNRYNDKFIMYPDTNNIKFILDLYNNISNSISEYNISKINDDEERNNFLNVYFKALDKTISESTDYDIYKLFREIRYKDEKWLDEKVNIIMKYSDDKEVIINRNITKEFKKLSIRDIVLESGVILDIRTKINKMKKEIEDNTYVDNIQTYEHYQDAISYKKRILHKGDYIYIVDEYFIDDIEYDFREKFEENFNDFIHYIEKELGKGKSDLFEKLQEEAEYHAYITKDDYDKITDVLENIIRTSNYVKRNRKLREMSSILLSKLKKLNKTVIQEQEKDRCIEIIDEIMEDFKEIVKISISKDTVYNKNKSNFYIIFNKMREELLNGMKDGNYRGFIEYIKDKERRLKEVDIDV